MQTGLGIRRRLRSTLSRVKRRIDQVRVDEFPSFEALSEYPPDDQIPFLDRRNIDESKLTEHQRQWRNQGYVLLKKFIPDDLIEAYSKVRSQWQDPGGWGSPVPYMHVPELKELGLYRPLTEVMKSLFGDEVMMHLNLTGWISTQRDWHQDDYLNPPFVNSHYVAAWFALDTIHPDCGPFEFVPGSNRWPVLRQEKIRDHLAIFRPGAEKKEGRPEDGPGGHWASLSEYFVVPAIERKIRESRLPVQSFLGEKGDVLLWHGRLAHRGSKARVPGMMRKAFIAHYSEINHRLDMKGQAEQHPNGSWFARFNLPLY
jgi:hypothetical protein